MEQTCESPAVQAGLQVKGGAEPVVAPIIPPASMAEQAFVYVARGWSVIAVHYPSPNGDCTCGNPTCPNPGKHPVGQWRAYHKRRATEAEVRAWFSQARNTRNVGIVTGLISGLLVVDVDGQEGQVALEALARAGYALPEGPRVKTGSGGLHIYLRWPAGRDVSGTVRLLPGLDLRGRGNQVVAPPSMHASGRPYEWLTPADADLPEAPAWLPEMADWLRKAGIPGKLRDLSRIVEGTRDNTLTSLGGCMRRVDMPAEMMAAALAAINAALCAPPLSSKDVERIARSVVRYPAATTGQQEAPAQEQETERQSQAQVLIGYGREAELWHDPDRNAHATITVGEDGHNENWPVRSKGFRRWLRERFYAQFQKPPGAQAVQDAVEQLDAQAALHGKQYPVFVRVGEAQGNIYVDLCNERWEAVEITPSGWRAMANPPAKFRRTKGMTALPYPVASGSVNELRPFVNTGSDEDRGLLVAWVLAALRPTGPYPVLPLQGEQGSAKSTTARVLKALVDPSTAPLRTAPRDERDLMIAANNSWALAFDNLSGVGGWFSDALCRLATGGGFATRELYENAEEAIFSAMRPVILTGIDALTERQDLTDRSIILNLPAIEENRRKDERTFWKDFEAARPRILGAFYDAVSRALRDQDTIKLDKLPRMADFALWVAAAEPALPWELGTFLAAYSGNRAEAVELSLEADPVASSVRQLLEQQERWNGTPQELLDKLKSLVPEDVTRTKSWPRKPNTLSMRIKRAATFLRQVGVDVEWTREPGGNRTRKVTLSCVPTVPTVPEKAEKPSGSVFSGWDDDTRGRDDDEVHAAGSSLLSSPRKASYERLWDDGDGRDARIRLSSQTAAAMEEVF